MLVPGLSFSAAGRVQITTGSGIVPNFFNQGFGFMNDGSLAIDGGVPTGNFYTSGFRQTATGALYGIDLVNLYIEGIPIGTDGVIGIQELDPVAFSNGMPLTVNGFVAVDP